MTASKTFDVPDIHCNHCKMSIEGAVSALDGVADVSVRIDERAVDVSFDTDAVEEGAIVAAIEEQGYAVSG